MRELPQLFDSLDPSPFHDRDLDDDARVFIVESARELPHDASLGLRVHVERLPDDQNEAVAVLRQAVRAHFLRSAESSHRSLRNLFRRGRQSLAIGLPILVVAAITGHLVGVVASPSPWRIVLRESLIIGGWVAMWRPMEIFLYDWWPIRADRRLYQRLADMPVEIVQSKAAAR